MGNLLCMGLILGFRWIPSPRGLDHSHYRLAAGMYVHVLDRNFLLAFAAIAVQCLEEGGVGPRKLVGLIQILASTLE